MARDRSFADYVREKLYNRIYKVSVKHSGG